MSCKYYNNNGCSCAGCKHFVKSINVTNEKNVVLISLPEMTLHNHEKICLCIAQSIPGPIDANTTVNIKVGDETMAVITKLGNLLYADAIKSRKVYPLMVATDTNAFVLMDLCKISGTEHVFPTIPETQPSKYSISTDNKKQKKEG